MKELNLLCKNKIYVKLTCARCHESLEGTLILFNEDYVRLDISVDPCSCMKEIPVIQPNFPAPNLQAPSQKEKDYDFFA